MCYNKIVKIKNVELKNNLVLAPMAGVSDVGFRNLALGFGAGLVTTEMVSARAMRFGSKNTFSLLETLEDERPVAVQLFGHDPVDFEYALSCGALDKFDIIDLNFGCPAPKIVKNGEGSALMRDLPLAGKIVETCVKNTNKPVTVKFRKSFFEDGLECVELAKICEECGASALTIHGRTRPQMYSGNVDLEAIADVKSAVHIPVFGNGDVVDKESLERMKKTGVDGVAIGRGAQGKPWIFEELTRGERVEVDKFDIICRHIEILKKFYSENHINVYIRKHLLWYLKDEQNAKQEKIKIVTAKTLDESMRILKNYFEGRKNEKNN